MSHGPYQIMDVTTWTAMADEPQGGKTKSWLLMPETRQHWLFKPRAQGGDDWAERVAAEVARLLGLPCPVVELARQGGAPGVISLDFTASGESGDLVLGNNLLLEQDPRYPSGNRFRVTSHTVDNALRVLLQPHIKVPDGPHASLPSAAEMFLGYLLLDALIGNTDRHHENWGILRKPIPAKPLNSVLAPSFDHAASLGQILDDRERLGRLGTRDAGYSVAAYVRRARSALYLSEQDRRPLSLVDAFRKAGDRFPSSARYWQHVLAAVPPALLACCVARVPEQVASEAAREFASRMLLVNRQFLLEVSFS